MTSYYSQLHFGNHKVMSNYSRRSDMQASVFNLVAKGVHRFYRWIRVISVILEKKPLLYKVDKLISILLVEADFHFIKNSL